MGRGVLDSVAARFAARAVVVAGILVACLLMSDGSAWADGPDLFVTNQGSYTLTPGGTANVGAFTIGAGGALTSFSGSPFTLPDGDYPYGPAVTPDDRFLYVDDQVSDVYPYALGSGSATAGSPVSTGSGSKPGLDLISPGGQRLYVLSPGASTVSGFAIAGNGTLTSLPGSPYPVTISTPDWMAMTPDGTHLFAAGDTAPDQLEEFNVAADGSLSVSSGSPYTLGENTNGLRTTPNGEYLYTTNFDPTTPISIFAIEAGGTLSPVTPPTPPAGVDPFSPPEISPNGQELYVAEDNGTILGYTIGSDGTLTPQQGSPYAGVSTNGGVETWDLELTPDGRELYAVASPGATTSDGEISTFDVGAGGALTLLPGTVDTGGTEPVEESMTISPDPGPVAAIAAAPAAAGSATLFSAAASHATDAIYGALVYSWSFGDGTVANDAGPSPTHVYALPGTYTATVTVTDAAGCSTALVWTGLNSFCAGDPAAGASTSVTVPAPTAVQPPPALVATSARFGNQQITLVTPSPKACTAKPKKLSVSLGSTAIKGSKATKLKFSSAAFYLDKGIKHTRKKTTKTRSGKRKRITVTSYSANATEHRVPVSISLSIAGLKAGTHTLTVTLSYRETKVKHGHRTTVTVTKTLKAKFKVC